MRILYFGSTRGTAGALHYFTAMVSANLQVVAYDPDYFQSSGVVKLVSKITKRPSPRRVEKVSEELIRLCRDNRFDVVFVMAENFLGSQTIEEARAVCKTPPIFMYHSHDNNFSDGILKPKDFWETLKAYDYVFTTKSQNVGRYKALGQEQSFFLPSAYEPMVHHPITAEKSAYTQQNLDVTFVGTYARSREPWLQAADWQRLHVWGSDWKRFPEYSDYLERIDPRPIYYFEFADVLTHSKCSLGLLREEAEDRHTQRTFEIPACGGFQLAPRNEEILSFFEENKEIVCFSSPDELKEKIDFYLKHETEREKIARAGYERCIASGHRYEDRIYQVLEIVSRQHRRLAQALP
jgi:spore maturation protein CgeB